jgi:hypothetical protein
MKSIQLKFTFNDIDFVYNWKYYISLRIVLIWISNWKKKEINKEVRVGLEKIFNNS